MTNGGLSQNKLQYLDTQIIIFAREPVYGQVKTRLIPALGAAGATELYTALLDFTLNKIHTYHLAPVCLCITPESRTAFFLKRYPFTELQITTQKGDDLGQRMAHALKQSLSHFSRAILIGTDCPFLNQNDLEQAIAALDNHDMVFSPARDGGYVLVGARCSVPGNFTGIDWGSEQVMRQTRKRLKELKISWQELARQQDIDDENDLKYLQHVHEFSDAFPHILNIINGYS